MNTQYLRPETKEMLSLIDSERVFESIEKFGVIEIHHQDKMFIIFKLKDGSLAENIYMELPNGGLYCISD
jgi:hypothetical protein